MRRPRVPGVGVFVSMASVAAILLSSEAHPTDIEAPHAQGHGTAASCQDCHEDIWDAWRNSRHAASFTNPLFQLSIKEARRRDWCLSCHLPREAQRDQLREVGLSGAAGTLIADGVDCHTCHVDHGTLTTRGTPSVEALSVHKVVSDAELGASSFCGRCHQFEGPGEHPPYEIGGDPLQDTYAEWQRTGSEQTCQDCHMPKGRHSFSGGHDVELVRRALDIDIARDHDELVLTLQTTDAVAHKVPTGDPFRRLRISLCEDEACTRPVWVRHLGVAHEHRDGVLRVTHDTRLTPGVPWQARTTPSENAAYWQVALMYGEVHLTPKVPLAEQRGIIAAGPL